MDTLSPPITIGSLRFDHASYDAKGDVLYLSVGAPRAAADSEETPEGHVVRFDDTGEIIGVTLISPKHLLARDGELTITLPTAVHASAADLAALLVA